VEWAYDDSDVIKKYAVGKRNENVEIRSKQTQSLFI
jgi:hypothetical protein